MGDAEDLCRFNGRVRFRVNNKDLYGMQIDTSLNKRNMHLAKRSRSETTYKKEEPLNLMFNEQVYNLNRGSSSRSISKQSDININPNLPPNPINKPSDMDTKSILKPITKKLDLKFNIDNVKNDAKDLFKPLVESLSTKFPEKTKNKGIINRFYGLFRPKPKTSIERSQELIDDNHVYVLEEKETQGLTKDQVRERYTNLDYQNYVQEFAKIRFNYGITLDESKLPQNQAKNYNNQLCYDYNRVSLLEADGGSGYINANYVDGYAQKKAFICTQSPRDETLNDFWLMVWQEDSHTIVMLNEMQEFKNGEVLFSCSQYWPFKGQIMHTKDFAIKNIYSYSQKNFQLDVLHVKKKAKEDAASLVFNWQYLTWPTVLDIKSMETVAYDLFLFTLAIKFSQPELTPRIESEKEWKDVHPPIIVHSFDGCHKTGLFCALVNQKDYWAANGLNNVPERIKEIRKQRHMTFPRVDEYIMFIMTCMYELDIDADAYLQNMLQEYERSNEERQ